LHCEVDLWRRAFRAAVAFALVEPVKNLAFVKSSVRGDASTGSARGTPAAYRTTTAQTSCGALFMVRYLTTNEGMMQHERGMMERVLGES
jgi:hypothetical protein